MKMGKNIGQIKIETTLIFNIIEREEFSFGGVSQDFYEKKYFVHSKNNEVFFDESFDSAEEAEKKIREYVSNFGV